MAIELKSSFLFPKGKGIEFSFVSEESNIDFENKIMEQKLTKVFLYNFCTIFGKLLLNLYLKLGTSWAKCCKGKIKTIVRQLSKTFNINSLHRAYQHHSMGIFHFSFFELIVLIQLK